MQPHRRREGRTTDPEDPEVFRPPAATVGDLYEPAGWLAARGLHLVSTAEKTGIQALQRLDPDIPPAPGRGQRRESESICHGTLCLTAPLEIWCGWISAPTRTPTRTAAAVVAPGEQTVATDPRAGWVVITDNLNTHQAESLVLGVAQTCGIEEDLGAKGQRGVLKSPTSRAAFLSDPSHRIRFVSTPPPPSWLPPIELWFGILVRKLLRRSRFNSVEDLKARILAFINYFNHTMAKPIRWLSSVEPRPSTGTG